MNNPTFVIPGLGVALLVLAALVYAVADRPAAGIVLDKSTLAESVEVVDRSECAMWLPRTTYVSGTAYVSTYCASYRYYQQERIWPEAYVLVTQPYPEEKPAKRFRVWVDAASFTRVPLGGWFDFDDPQAAVHYERPHHWGRRL